MAPARQDNTGFSSEFRGQNDVVDLHQRSALLFREHRSDSEEMCVRAQRTHPCYRQRLSPPLKSRLRREDSHLGVAVIETETISHAKMTVVHPRLYPTIIPPASPSTTTANSSLLHRKDHSNTHIALIIVGVLLCLVMSLGIILVAQSSRKWKGREQVKDPKRCCRHSSTLKKERNVLGKETSFVGADCDNPTWHTVTCAVHSNNWVRKLSVIEQSYSVPSNIPTVAEHSTSIPSEQPVFETDCKKDDFQGRLQVEEEDIALALTIALRDLSPSSWSVDGVAPAEQSLFSSAEPLPSDASFEVDTPLQVYNRCSSLGSNNTSRRGSEASTTSQATMTDVIDFSSASPRSSMTSSASVQNCFDEGLEIPYQIKRARTQSVEIKQGILVAWQGANSNSVTATIPNTGLALLSPLGLGLDTSYGIGSSSPHDSFSLTLGKCNATASRFVRESSLKTTHSRGTSLVEGDHSTCSRPIPHLVVTCPSTSTIFTIDSSISIDLSDFPSPPTMYINCI